MGKLVGNKEDPPFEQKWVLLQFASRNNKKYESGDTVGIKVCGAFESEEELKTKAEELYLNGNIYFKLESQKVGHWFGFPDYTQDKREDKEFINSKAKGAFEDVFDLNEMYKSHKENDKQRIQMETEKKTTIKNSTYFYVPEKKEDLEYLITIILQSLDNFYNDIDFYKNVMKHLIIQIKKVQENPPVIEEDTNLEIEEDVDYLDLTADKPYEQKHVLLSFVHEKSRQKSSSLGFKIRGVFNDDKSFDERKNLLLKKDPYFDLCKIPVGCWIPFSNCKSYIEAQGELNQIVGLEIKKQIEKKKEFERRIENVRQRKKEGYVEDSQVILTEEDLNNQMQEAISRIKETKEEIVSYFKMLNKNINLHKKRYGDLNEELQTSFENFKDTEEYKLSDESTKVSTDDKLISSSSSL